MEIQGSDGPHYGTHTDEYGRFRTFATSETELSWASQQNGDAYTFMNVSYDYAALDTILLVENTSETKDLVIHRIFVQGDTATEFQIQCPIVSFTPTGTAVTGKNINRRSNNSASATAIADETANAQGDIIFNGWIVAGAAPFGLPIDGSIILGQGNSIGIDYVTDGGEARVGIVAYYRIPTF